MPDGLIAGRSVDENNALHVSDPNLFRTNPPAERLGFWVDSESSNQDEAS
jgi:hypothetical protein